MLAEDFDTDALAALMDPDIRFSEMPHLINPEGTERGRDEALAGFRKGRELLAGRARDAGRRRHDRGARDLARDAGRDGSGADAHIATFTRVRGGRIRRHATYDCYEPI